MAQQPLRLTMLSPLPVYLDETAEGAALAPRPETLDGRVVGLLPNWRPSAVKLLTAVGQLLSERLKTRRLPLSGGTSAAKSSTLLPLRRMRRRPPGCCQFSFR